MKNARSGFLLVLAGNKNGTVNFDEKFAEEVHNYRVLYDKECKDFKDNNKNLQAKETTRSEDAVCSPPY